MLLFLLNCLLLPYQLKGVIFAPQYVIIMTNKYVKLTRSMIIFLNQKILTLDKLINQQEGILAYKVINGTYLLGDILTDRHELDHYQLRNYENLRISLR